MAIKSKAKLMNIRKHRLSTPVLTAMLAAVLFGASTPATKFLTGQVSSQLLAGVLYLGSGIGLQIFSIFSKTTGKTQEAKLGKRDIPWLAGAILCGGIAGPLLLMIGINKSTAGSASLLLNLEAVFTALLAWFAFKENFDRRIFAGMIAIVAGSLLLAWRPDSHDLFSSGALPIIAACFCWALDNNLTRNISSADPVQIASLKGLVAGAANTTIALVAGSSLPALQITLLAMLAGLLGYGISLVLFIKSLRSLGTARTSAYFATAPFVGAIISILALDEPITKTFLLAAVLMAIGVWLHVTESHHHEHTHQNLEHEHLHTHDEHHQHEHDPDDPAGETHSHWHRHESITHSHPHYPDLHHRHEH